MMSEVLRQKTFHRRRTPSFSVSGRRRAFVGRRQPVFSVESMCGGLTRALRIVFAAAAWLLGRSFALAASLASAGRRAAGGTIAKAAGAEAVRKTPYINAVKKFASKAGWGIAAGVLAVFCLFFITGNIVPYIKSHGLTLSLPIDAQAAAILNSFIDSPAPADAQEEAFRAPQEAQLPGTLALKNRRVEKGESLAGIASGAGLNLDTLLSVNHINDVRKVPIGAELKLPNQNGLLHIVKRGESVTSIAQAYSVTTHAIADVNNLPSSVIHPGQELFIPGARMKQLELKRILGELFVPPVSGRLSSPFGMRPDPFTGVSRFHNGIDIAGPIGTPVVAAMAGRVAKIGVHPTYGKYIIIVHSGGYQTWYAHLDKTRIEQGKTVEQGQLIAERGNTGYSSGPHLHFSIFKNESAVDPLKFLR